MAAYSISNSRMLCFVLNIPNNKMRKGNMFFCKSCRKPWEKFWDNNLSKFVKYSNVPTYGLDRKECESCSVGKTYEMA